jgi:bacteriorhodopsin
MDSTVRLGRHTRFITTRDATYGRSLHLALGIPILLVLLKVLADQTQALSASSTDTFSALKGSSLTSDS